MPAREEQWNTEMRNSLQRFSFLPSPLTLLSLLLCELILRGKWLRFYKRAGFGQSSSSIVRSRRNTLPAFPTSADQQRCCCSRAGSGMSPAPAPCPSSTPYLVSLEPRAACSAVSLAQSGPRLSAGRDNTKMDKGRRWRERHEAASPLGEEEEVAWSHSAMAGNGAYLGSALPGRGWLLPFVRLMHRPPGRLLNASTAALRRGSAAGGPPGAAWHPSPCLPCASPERHCWEGAPKLMSPALYPPLPTLLGFGPASSTCGLSSPLWAFLPLPFLWLRMSPQTRFYESGLVQGLYKVFSEIRGLVICKANKNVQ